MPRLNTKKELALKVKISQERGRRLEKDIQREHEKQKKLREKMKVAPSN
jgi:hypothetical protein